MKIICNLPNASENINGIQFEKIDGVMVSVKDIDDLDEEQVTRLSNIDGYSIQAIQHEVDSQPEETAEQTEAPVQRKRRTRRTA